MTLIMRRSLTTLAATALTFAALESEFEMSPASAAEPLRVYGQGGPLPAMEAAEAFSRANSIAVEGKAGPLPNWLPQAKQDADLVFSGSES